MNRKNYLYFAALLFILITLISCGKKNIGYGTILWSDNKGLFSTGEIVTIISQSELADVYLIKNDNSTEPVQIERWRVSFFDELSQAENYSAEIIKYKTIFARNLKDGLLIRKEPDINSDRVYKMRTNQILKVYGKTDTIATIGQYEGYWYKVITEDGTNGYCFDHYLDVYDSSISPEKKVNPAKLLMTKAFSQVYRPSKFIDMIKNNAVNLKIFDQKIGLFPDPDNKKLNLLTSEYSITFTWDKLSLVDNRSFSLGENGAVVHILSDSKLQLDYYYQDQKKTMLFVVIEGMEDIILKESERREALYTAFLEAGNSMSSNAYGTIKINIDGSFSWTGYDKLVPQIIPTGSNGSGKLRFEKFVGESLKEEFTGIISFYFNFGEKQIPVYFLYTLEEKKLRITYVPDKDINNLGIVTKKSISPVVIAFSFN